MTHPTITSLPTETLGSIFGHFCLHCCHGDTEGPDSYFRSSDHPYQQQEAHERSWYLADYRQPLVSLCLVSRRFRDVAQQVLHHEFVLGYGDSWRSAASSWDRRLTTFLRTVGRRDDLANAVRRVSLHPRLLEAAELGDAGAVVELRRMGHALGLESGVEARPPCYQARPGHGRHQPPTPERTIERYQHELRWLNHIPREDYVDLYTSTEGFRERHALGLELLAILIGILPSVERLSIQQTVVDYDTPYLSGLRSMTTAKGAHLLKTLDFATHDHMSELMIKMPSQAAATLELAQGTLQTLNLHMCNGFWANSENAPTFRSLKTLRLTQSHLSAVELRVLLSCCTGGLTSFTYEAASARSSFSGSQFHPREAIQALSPHRRTLKTLHLDLRPVFESLFIQPMAPASLGGFTALEDLFLSANTLWRKDQASPADEAEGTRLLLQLLPASTASLCITGPDVDRRLRLLPAELLGIARAAAGGEGRLSRLRQVRCDSRIKWRLDKGLGPEIESIFRAAGVEFGFASWPLSQTTVASKDVPEPLKRGMMEPFNLDTRDWEEWERDQAERKEAEREEAARREREPR